MTNVELEFIQRFCIHSKMRKWYVLYTPPEPEKHDYNVVYQCLKCYNKWHCEKEEPEMEERVVEEHK